MSFSERDQRDFQEAARLHQTGNLPAAIGLYQKILKRSPKQPIVQNLLGLAEFQAGQFEAAADNLTKALALDPHIPDLHYNLATVLQRLGRFEQALLYFEKAVAAKPNDADARNNFGSALKSLGRSEDAADAFRKAVAIDPNHAGAHLNLGNALCAQKNEEEGIVHIERSIALQPRNPDSYVSLGNALVSLKRQGEAAAALEKAIALKPVPETAETCFSRGMLFASLKRLDEAAGHFLRATQLKVDFADAYIELGNALEKMERYAEALPYFEKAVELSPGNAIAHYNVGNVLLTLERSQDSIAPLRRAVDLNPNFGKAITALGGALLDVKQYTEAQSLLEKSLSIEPHDPVTHIVLANFFAQQQRHDQGLKHLREALSIDPQHKAVQSWSMGYLCLELGEFELGWELHENRFKKPANPMHYQNYSAPRWDGSHVAGTLLAWGEQGIGDHILWASILPDLKPCAEKLIVECEPRLVPLFRRSFQGMEILPLDQEKLYDGHIDAHVPFASLGRFLRPNLKSFSRSEHGYLRADETRTQELRAKIAADSKTSIGLSWRSGNIYFGAEKTAKLRDFESVLRIGNARFFDLQYGDTLEERAQVETETGVTVQRLDEIDNTNDIDGLASLIMACDIVVTTSNTTVHLAGALGKDTWLLVPFAKGRIWYWFKDRLDSLWYPRLHLVRQAQGESWASVADRAATELSAFLNGR